MQRKMQVRQRLDGDAVTCQTGDSVKWLKHCSLFSVFFAIRTLACSGGNMNCGCKWYRSKKIMNWIPKPQQEHFNCRSFSLSPLKQAVELKANPGKNAPVWAFWTSFISSQSMSMWLWTLEMTLINYAWIVYCKSYASWMMMWLKFLEQLHQKRLHSYKKKKNVDAHWLSSTKKDILV